MKIKNTGCALCDSTWGYYYRIIEQTQLFFCCEVCADLYQDIVNRIKKTYQISEIDYMEIKGNSKERSFKVSSDQKIFRGKISFSNGKVVQFQNMSKIKDI